ncbi:MAG: 50S ribosomal protein L25 [Spirochaetales bacterium]|jgi:large subunit ribosomal protein L25|nr:50S ribosomal protein L25 [Spirochaetales bacterium]
MSDRLLNAELRRQFKKGPTRSLRKEGRIPAIIYGHQAPVAVSLDETLFHKSFKAIGANTIFDVDIQGDHRSVLVKDIQEDILSGKILHIDFYEIEKGKTLRTTVPLRITGASPGVKEGGVLEEHLHSLEIECIPAVIPGFIEVDVSRLKLNESIHVRDLEIPPDVRVLTGGEQAVIGVSLIRESSQAGETGTAEAGGEAQGSSESKSS